MLEFGGFPAGYFKGRRNPKTDSSGPEISVNMAFQPFFKIDFQL